MNMYYVAGPNGVAIQGLRFMSHYNSYNVAYMEIQCFERRWQWVAHYSYVSIYRLTIEMNANIYRLIDPATERTRYIGITTSTLSGRLSGHISDQALSNKKKQNWIASIIEKGERPYIEPIEKVYVGDPESREYFWWKHYKSEGHDLLNIRVPSRSFGIQFAINSPSSRIYLMDRWDILRIVDGNQNCIGIQLLKRDRAPTNGELKTLQLEMGL